jgi:hypothetical protein
MAARLTEDVDELEFLRFLDNRIPSVPFAKQPFIVPELQKLVVLLGQRPGYVVKEVFHGGHDVLLSRDRSHDAKGVKRQRLEKRETCRVFFHRRWPQKWTWDLPDSKAYFTDQTSSLASLDDAAQFWIVVVPSEVSARARNEGFSAQAKRRILPLSQADLDAVDMTPEGRRHAPKLADAAVAASALNCGVEELLDLPLLRVSDAAVLWDLDMLIGSYVHCPPSHTSFRLVASVDD